MNFTCTRIQLLALRRRGVDWVARIAALERLFGSLVGQNIRSGDLALDAGGIVLGDPVLIRLRQTPWRLGTAL
jgi:hypothetical protein